MAQARDHRNEAPSSREPLLGAFRFLHVEIRPHRRYVLILFLSLLGAALSVVALGIGLRFFINDGLLANNPLQLKEALFFMLGLVGLMAASSYGRLFCVSYLSENILCSLRERIFERLLAQPVPFFDTHPTGDLLARLAHDTTSLQGILLTTIPQALRNLFIFLGATLMVFWTSPVLAMGLTGIIPLVLVPLWLLRGPVKKNTQRTLASLGDATTVVTESLVGLSTVQAFRLESFMKGRFSTLLHQSVRTALKATQARACMTVCLMVLIFSAIAGILWLGAVRILHHQMTGGDLSSFIFYAILVASSLGSLGEAWGDLIKATAATSRLSDLLELPLEAQKESTLREHPESLLFQDVCFSYPSRPEVPVLRHVSFEVKPHRLIAFVGESGSGKSTLFNLMLGFYAPTHGVITLGGKELKDVSSQTLRSAMALVPQDPLLFSATLFDNIAYGNLDAPPSAIYEAARASGLTEFIEALPEGYQTWVGERGLRLSGGQRQRVAIARALLKRAPFLLLDEATSALDAKYENLIHQGLAPLKEHTTVLVITHRLSTIQEADHIIVLDHGSIVASGSHQDLLHQKGVYQTLARLQLLKSFSSSDEAPSRGSL